MIGIYQRDVVAGSGGVQKITDRNTTVPAPNNSPCIRRISKLFEGKAHEFLKQSQFIGLIA